MSDLSTWENTALGNDKTPVPDFLKEGASPISSVNNWGREVQASVRRFYENIEWRDFGFTVSFNSNTAVNVESGTDTFFSIGQRVQLGPVVQYATITNISGDVVLDLDVDAGADVDAGVDTIAVGIDPTGAPGGGAFTVGTRMLFQQTDAPLGWTKDTTSVNERALRVVSGNVVNGGDTNFTTVFSATRGTDAEPNHVHSSGTLITEATAQKTTTDDSGGTPRASDVHTHAVSGTTGSSGTHSHTSDLAVFYLDVIVAVKE